MFKKCETLLQNIVYMSIMAAINVVFALLTTLFPYALFLLVFILPLTSAVVTLYCNKKYFIIYFFATLSLCMFATLWNVSDTIFYIFPSLISGFIFGLAIEREIPAVYAILVVSLVQFGFHYLSVVIIRFLLNLDIISAFVELFGLTSHPYLSYIIPGFIFFLSLTQTSITFLVIKNQIPKLILTYKEFNFRNWFDSVFVFLNSILMILFAFFLKEASLITLFISIFVSIYLLGLSIVTKHKIFIIGNICSILIGVILYAFLYSYIVTPLQLLLLNVGTIFQAIIVLINNSFVNKRLKVK